MLSDTTKDILSRGRAKPLEVICQAFEQSLSERNKDWRNLPEQDKKALFGEVSKELRDNPLEGIARNTVEFYLVVAKRSLWFEVDLATARQFTNKQLEEQI